MKRDKMRDDAAGVRWQRRTEEVRRHTAKNRIPGRKKAAQVRTPTVMQVE